MDPSIYSYPSPLAGFEGLPPLPEVKAEDGKSASPPVQNSQSFLTQHK